MEAPAIINQDPEVAMEKTQDKRTHVTALPPGFITVRIMQLLGAIIILGLIAADFAGIEGSFESLIGMITAIVMTIIYGWIMLTYWVPSLYNYWAILTFEILGLFIWVDGFVWLLSNSFENYYWGDNCTYTYDVDTESYLNDCGSEPSDFQSLQNAAIAAATFGAIEMILAFVSLVVVSVFIARHREAGGHNKIGSVAPLPVTSVSDLVRENEALRRGQLKLQEQVMVLQQQSGAHHQVSRETNEMTSA